MSMDVKRKPTTRRYSPEERERAVRMASGMRRELGRLRARWLGRRPSSISVLSRCGRGYAKPRSRGERPGTSSVEAGGAQGVASGGEGAAPGQLDPQVGVGFFAAESTAPRSDRRLSSTSTSASSELSRSAGSQWGRRQIAPSTYYAAKSRPPSARATCDAVMMQVLMVLWVANRKVYGAHKLWKAARRAGHDIGRDQVARLMGGLEIQGISRRRRKVFTTVG